MSDNRGDYLAKLALLFAVYFITARIGLNLGAVSGFATTVWPPTGIALAAMLIMGYRYWPGIAAGAFLVNSLTGAPEAVALGISAGNTLEALFGAYLLNRYVKIDIALNRVNDVLGLIFFAGILSTIVSATIGVISLLLGDVLSSSEVSEVWIAWWIGDILSVLVFAPFIMVWRARLRSKLDMQRLKQSIVPITSLIVASFLIFFGIASLGIKPFAYAYIIYPFMVWIVLRFDQRGSVTAIFIVSLIAIWGTVANYSSTSTTTSLSQTLLLLQSFIGITSATFMVMAAVVSEREQNYKQRQMLLQRTELLTKQRSRLKALNQTKDEFISIASHQLRTPASSVKQYIGMLLDGYAGKMRKQQSEFVLAAYASNEQQIKIIDSLLNIARLDANKIRPNKIKCDITRLVGEVVTEQVKEFNKRNQRLAFKPGKRIINLTVDKELIRMVIENLIDNAGKYSADGETVTVKVTRDNNHVHLLITDSGIGISKTDQKKLFQKFSRISDSHAGFIDGSGLGLYWAKKVVTMHGGSISLTSKLNSGSTFNVSLPIKAK